MSKIYFHQTSVSHWVLIHYTVTKIIHTPFINHTASRLGWETLINTKTGSSDRKCIHIQHQQSVNNFIKIYFIQGNMINTSGG